MSDIAICLMILLILAPYWLPVLIKWFKGD
jgi:hypothetical protein